MALVATLGGALGEQGRGGLAALALSRSLRGHAVFGPTGLVRNCAQGAGGPMSPQEMTKAAAATPAPPPTSGLLLLDRVGAGTETGTESGTGTGVEAIVGNACRLATEPSGDDGDVNNDDKALQGLLIATLSVLTEQRRARGSSRDGEEDDGSGSEVPADLRKKGRMRGGKDEDSETSEQPPPDGAGTGAALEPPPSVRLQVGGPLSLLGNSVPSFVGSSGDKQSETVRNTKTMVLTPSDLPSEALLHYLSEAASSYEERIEVQKGRLLGRLRRERERERRKDGKREQEEERERAAASAALTTPAPAAAPISPPLTRGGCRAAFNICRRACRQGGDPCDLALIRCCCASRNPPVSAGAGDGCGVGGVPSISPTFSTPFPSSEGGSSPICLGR